MEGVNAYYSILQCALNKEERPIDKEIGEYKEALAKETRSAYKNIANSNAFPYCLCSLSLSQVERAIEIEYVSLTPRSMHIGLITAENISKDSCKSGKLNKEVLILRCRCAKNKEIDWDSNPLYAKVVCLLVDYKNKIESNMKVFNKIFKNREIDDGEREDESKSEIKDTEIEKELERRISKKNIRELLRTTEITAEQNKLLNKIIKSTRKIKK
ncbi:hypothetical protein NEMIN01_2423 [Nematocida minor]|uniref:uncharacterized protein n=1 Tax=Nematocida minor TaxID=1912983 RepID=UPI00221F254E|nr:uncharacterized protein NEMIN01_2423 [Nematocida minor]KAI5193225.1 hypothetical protein NEMIN01_2423 [Nematocida minor]